jgi:hypothetical protein
MTKYNIWGKNIKLEKFWKKLSQGKMVVVIYSNKKYKKVILKSKAFTKKIFKNLNEDSEVKAILITGISVDWYEYLYKKAKNKEPEYVINNYKKYSKNTEDKFWFLGDI